MQEVLTAVSKCIIPDKRTCKSYNIKAVMSTSSHLGVINNLFYSGTLFMSNVGNGTYYGDVNFMRILIDENIKLTFNMLHVYGSLLTNAYNVRPLFISDNIAFLYDYNDSKSLECAAEKILQIFRVVREINRVSRRKGDYDGVVEIVRDRFRIC